MAKRGKRAKWREAVLWAWARDGFAPCARWMERIDRLSPMGLLRAARRERQSVRPLYPLVGESAWGPNGCGCEQCWPEQAAAKRKLAELAKKGPRAILAAARKLGFEREVTL